MIILHIRHSWIVASLGARRPVLVMMPFVSNSPSVAGSDTLPVSRVQIAGTPKKAAISSTMIAIGIASTGLAKALPTISRKPYDQQ